MPTTTYKSLEVQTTSSNSGTWGTVLNESVIELIDKMIGGIVTKTASGSDISLTASESQNLIVRITGTLTANIIVSTQEVGFHIVENLTSGNYTLNFSDGVASVEIPQGSRCLVAMDATNGARRITGEFKTGDTLPFYQSTAPVGWTKLTTAALNDAAFRLVTDSNGGSTGGSSAFTTVFASRTPSGTVGATTLTIDQIPSHNHSYSGLIVSASHPTGTGGVEARGAVTSQSSGASGGDGSHAHSWTGDAMDFAVKYANFLLASKA